MNFEPLELVKGVKGRDLVLLPRHFPRRWSFRSFLRLANWVRLAYVELLYDGGEGGSQIELDFTKFPNAVVFFFLF